MSNTATAVRTPWRVLDRDDQRVLAALDLVDGCNGARITRPLQAQALAPAAPGSGLPPRPLAPADPRQPRLTRNRSGLLVLQAWATLADHAGAFASPPDSPAIASQTLDLRISDPGGLYQPRDLQLALPRDPDPAHRGQPGSLFSPVRVPMLRASQAPLGANWAALMLSVGLAAGANEPPDALGGALVEVFGADAGLLGRAVTDWRGEAVLPVVGVPIATWGDGDDAVVVDQIPATVRVRWPAGLGTRVAAADLAAGRAPARLPVIDPDRLPANPPPLASAALPISLAAGRRQPLRVLLALPP